MPARCSTPSSSTCACPRSSGLVGAGGLGRLIDEVRGFYRYGALTVIILEILVVVIAIEVASNYLRKRLR